jgi:hypothetical protein
MEELDVRKLLLEKSVSVPLCPPLMYWSGIEPRPPQ